jgi:hypothetical protein
VIEPGGRPQPGCRYFGRLARQRFRLDGYRLRWRGIDGRCLDPDRLDGGRFDPDRAGIDGGRLRLDDEGLGFGLTEKLELGLGLGLPFWLGLGFECCLRLGRRSWSWFWVQLRLWLWLWLPLGFECCLSVEHSRHRLRFADYFFRLDRNRVRSEREHDLYPHRVRDERWWRRRRGSSGRRWR